MIGANVPSRQQNMVIFLLIRADFGVSFIKVRNLQGEKTLKLLLVATVTVPRGRKLEGSINGKNQLQSGNLAIATA